MDSNNPRRMEDYGSPETDDSLADVAPQSRGQYSDSGDSKEATNTNTSTEEGQFGEYDETGVGVDLTNEFDETGAGVHLTHEMDNT